MKTLKSNNQKKPASLLSIAGFDGSGGAGVGADYKVCSYLGIHNAAVVTCLVLQDPLAVKKIVPIKKDVIRDQIQILLDFYRVELVNIGVLGNPGIIGILEQLLSEKAIILDPVMMSGDGNIELFPKNRVADLLRLFKMTYLLTPNIPEAERILNRSITSEADMHTAAADIRRLGPRNVLLKGGHRTQRNSVDILAMHGEKMVYPSSLARVRIHGTGSYLNAAISAFLIRGNSLAESVRKAKDFLIRSIHRDIRRHPVLRPPAQLD